VARTASPDAGAGVPRLSDSFEPVPACAPVSRLLVLPSMIIDSSPSPSPFPCVRRWVKVRPRALVFFLHVRVGACLCFCIVFFAFPLMFCVCACVYVHLNTPFFPPRPFVCKYILFGGRFTFFWPSSFWLVRACLYVFVGSFLYAVFVCVRAWRSVHPIVFFCSAFVRVFVCVFACVCMSFCMFVSALVMR